MGFVVSVHYLLSTKQQTKLGVGRDQNQSWKRVNIGLTFIRCPEGEKKTVFLRVCCMCKQATVC